MEHSKIWYLQDFDLFQNMSAQEIGQVEEAVIMKALPRGERIHFARHLNKYVYLLKEGILKLMAIGDNGAETIVCLIQPGNLFGSLPLLGDFEIAEDYALAAEDSVVCFINADKLKDWMKENHDLRLRVRGQIGRRMRKIENRLLSMIFKDAKTRISDFILEFAREFGRQTAGGIEVRNFLTNDDVAKLTATSRQTVNSVLNELREKRLIRYDKNILLVPAGSALTDNS